MDRDIQDWEDVIVVFAQVENVRITHGGHFGSHLESSWTGCLAFVTSGCWRGTQSSCFYLSFITTTPHLAYLY